MGYSVNVQKTAEFKNQLDSFFVYPVLFIRQGVIFTIFPVCFCVFLGFRAWHPGQSGD